MTSNVRRRNARGEVSLRLILNETVKLVGQLGYDNTTIARITRAAGRPASSIYWYFDTKEALIAAALEGSYQPGPRTHVPWETFAPDVPLHEQISGHLEPELHVTETEKPLRLGIMLALEGSASHPDVQAPFRRRRAGAQVRILRWWSQALAEHFPDADASVAASLSALTLAFLDGHYISDDMVGETTAQERSQVLTAALVEAFGSLAGGRDSTRARTVDAGRPGPARSSAGSPENDGPRDEADAEMLRVTRSLVAEHGYEGATIGRICARTGLPSSSVYWRHKDKDALVRAAVADPFRDLFTPLTTLPDPDEAWKDELDAALRRVLHGARSCADTVRAGLLLKAQRREPPTSAGTAIVEHSVAVEDEMARWLARTPALQHRTDDLAARVAWAMCRLLDGFMLSPSLTPEPHRPLEAEDVLRLVDPMFSVLEVAARA